VAPGRDGLTGRFDGRRMQPCGCVSVFYELVDEAGLAGRVPRVCMHERRLQFVGGSRSCMRLGHRQVRIAIFTRYVYAVIVLKKRCLCRRSFRASDSKSIVFCQELFRLKNGTFGNLKS
jgi:hypothetical protein